MTLVVPFEEIFEDQTKLLAKHDSWERVELGEVCEVLNGFAFKSTLFNSSEGFPVIRIRDLAHGRTETFYKGDYPSEYVVENGDLLIGMDGNFGCYEWSGGKALLNQRVCKLIPHERYLHRKFLLFGINGYLKAIQDATSSVTVGHLSSRDIQRIPFPLPPLNEQRRIVAKLETLLSRVDAAQARLATIPRTLKRFRQSVLTAACSGRLTADWRYEQICLEPASAFLNHLSELGEEPKGTNVLPSEKELNKQREHFEIPEEWAVTNFGAVIASIRGGSTAVPENTPTMFPILRSSSVRPGVVDLNDVKYLAREASQNELNYLCEGDLLFTRLSGSLDYVANCAKVHGLNGRSIQYPDRLFCAKVLPPMNSSYCELVFAAPLVRSKIVEHAKSSAGHQRVSIANITDQLIPVPPITEQQEIVRRVEALFKTADALEARYHKAKAHVDKLTQSILARAFRGELVTTEVELARREGRDYEPASVLLERIRQERAQQATSAKPKPKQRRARPATSTR